MSSFGDLGTNLLASIIAGTAVWLFQRARRSWREGRKRRFFGLGPGTGCLISIPKHAASPMSHSVHRTDLAAVIEVAGIARDCSADVELGLGSQRASLHNPFGEKTEFCVGGPDGNARTGEHLVTFVPGLTMDSYADVGTDASLRVAGNAFARLPGKEEYVALAKVPVRGSLLFVVCGQTAVTNQAAVRYLAANHRRLRARHGMHGRFCLVLKVLNPKTYGDRVVHEVGDFTEAAFSDGSDRHVAEVAE